MGDQKKILIVEDEPDVMTYLSAIYEDNGYTTVQATDGIEGFNMAKSEKPDLISLDIAMPNQTGVRTYREYKQDPDLKDIPVIIITAVGDDFRRYLAKLKGFQKPEGFMNKPIDENRLLKMVADILAG
ncbi:MAG: response regulator [Desulfobacterales bacterium]|nr:response regulator [Desulfobacterales bacterium]